MNGCRKVLGLMNGKHHCRKCGRLFCENHSAYQMRLSKDAHSDPENGIWCRVCQKCYIEREGYKDVNGVSRNRTQAFLRLRKQRLNVVNLEANKLERRLEKLSLLYAGGNTISNRVPLANTVVPGSGRRAVEQAVVPWQEDHEVAACPLCAQTFSTLLNRRHHCRLCGRVICGKTSCNSSIAIHSEQEPGTAPTVPQIRVCLECKRIVTRRREAVQDLANVPRVIAMYPSVTRYRTLIDENLPKFNNLLMSMAARDTVECEDRDYQMATKLRQTLMDYFGELDKLGKTIRSFSSSTPDTQRLQRNVSLAIFNYLQNHMFTLQMMPKVGAQGVPANGHSVHTASQIEALTQEIEIMEEQYSQVSTFLDDAIRRRRLEDAQALKESVEDLRVAIETKRKEVQALLK
ncbi:carboxypeptidase Y-deficient [Gaertneriomyces sp. JEL0708]|nr:carboxypeptidase Y-deficient [Gaertneriomyces sp. JEL0708]